MNLLSCQSLRGRAEAMTISNVAENTVSMATNTSLFTLVQDVCSGFHLVSQPNQWLTRDEFMQCSMQAHRIDFNRVQKILQMHPDEVPCICLIEMVLPDDYFFMYEDEVLFRDGFKVHHRLLDKSIGQSMLCSLSIDYSSKKTVHFLSDLSRIFVYYLGEIYGLSTGLHDLMVNQEAVDESQKQIADIMFDARHAESASQRLDILSESSTLFDEYKHETSLNDVSAGLGVMVASKAKGKQHNLNSLLFSVGTQMIDGREAPRLPCMLDEKIPEFIEHSFLDGLSPDEFFTHCCAARDGIIDQQTGTSVTGYSNRKLNKSCEDIRASMLNTGRCGIVLRKSLLAVHSGPSPEFLLKIQFDLQNKRAHKLAEIYRLQLLHSVQSIYGYNQFKMDFFLPINAIHFLMKHQTNAQEKKVQEEVYTKLEKFLIQFPFDDQQSVLGLHLFDAVEAVGIESMNVLDQLLEQVLFKYESNQLEHGTAVGLLAASFYSMQCTQDTLNSFHSAGSSLDSGIVRSRQLLECQSHDAVVMVDTLIPELKKDHKKMNDLANQLIQVRLEEIIQSYQCVEYPESMNVLDEFRSESIFHSVNHEKVHLLIIDLNVKILLKRQLTLLSILQRLLEFLTIDVISNSLHATQPKLVFLFDTNDFEFSTVQQQISKLKKTTISGLDGILGASVSSDNRFRLICSSLDSIFLYNHIFDVTTMECNNALLMYEHFGIESSLSTLVKEFSLIVNVNSFWLYIVALLITSGGAPTAATSHGMNKHSINADPLLQAVFEQGKNVFSCAALFNQQSDDISTKFSASVIAGGLEHSQFGTGAVNLIFDDFTQNTIQNKNKKKQVNREPVHINPPKTVPKEKYLIPLLRRTVQYDIQDFFKYCQSNCGMTHQSVKKKRIKLVSSDKKQLKPNQLFKRVTKLPKQKKKRLFVPLTKFFQINP